MSKSIADQCAEEFVEVIPSLMQLMRHEMRFAAKEQLSVPQFRVLARLRRKAATNSEVADWVGVSFPAMTRMVNFLVDKGFVAKLSEGSDRRKLRLSLTKKGEEFFDACKSRSKKVFSQHFMKLSDKEKRQLLAAYDIFRKLGRLGGEYENDANVRSESLGT